MSGILDKAKGAVKEAAGSVTGNKDLESEGKMDQAKGHLKDAAANVKEGAERAVDNVKNAAAEKIRQHSEAAERKTETP